MMIHEIYCFVYWTSLRRFVALQNHDVQIVQVYPCVNLEGVPFESSIISMRSEPWLISCYSQTLIIRHCHILLIFIIYNPLAAGITSPVRSFISLRLIGLILKILVTLRGV